MKQDEWISVEVALPSKKGWYKIKTSHGEYEAPLLENGNKKLVWLVPDPSSITHWKSA
jgi:hypothetical protein